jgi:hypothetical protein
MVKPNAEKKNLMTAEARSNFFNILLKNKESKLPKTIFIIPLYLLITPFFIIGSIIIQLPLLLYISFYALTISSINLLINNKLLNSCTIPLTFTYLCVSIQDVMNLNFLFSIFHIPTVVSCLIIIQRKKHNLSIMMLFSGLYALWIFFIKDSLNFPFYDKVFGVKGAFNQAIVALLIGLFTSIIVSFANFIKKIK